MRRDEDLNGYGSGKSTRRNRALSLSPEEFEQVNEDYNDCLTLSDEEMAQIGNEYKNKLTLTPQDMAQISSEHTNTDNSQLIDEMDTLNIPSDANSVQLIHDYLKGIIGRFILVDFLIGTQSMIRKQGYLFSIGSNWILLYDDILKNFVMCDLYSIKFITSPYQKPTTSVNNNPMSALQSTNTMPQTPNNTSRRRR